MSWFECFGVDVVNVVRVEDARTGAIQNCLFTGWIGKAETAPAMVMVSIGGEIPLLY